MIQINREICIGCGNCAADCFVSNLRIKEEKAEVGGNCMMCGHCVAVCPVGAVFVEDSDYSMREVLEYQKEEFEIEPERLLRFIQFRRSIRHFQTRPVEPEKIKKVLEAGRYTQTASNREDVVYTVVQKEMEQVRPMVWESLRELGLEQLGQKDANPYAQRWVDLYEIWKQDQNNDSMFFNAPALVVITSDTKWNGLLAAESVELMANACGLGVLFSGFIERAVDRSQELRDRLGIGSQKIDACLLLGYPDITFYRTVPRKAANINWK